MRYLLTGLEAAKLLNISQPRVRQLAIAGTLKGVKRANRWFFHPQEVKRLKMERVK